MPRIFALSIFLLLSASSVLSQIQSADPRLLSDADYNVFLSQVENELPKWETALKGIDPAKTPQISYGAGKSILAQRNIGMMETDNIRDFIAMQRRKRTVYGELAIKGFFDSLFDVEEEITWMQAINGNPISTFDKYAPQLDALSARIGTDAMARVELLEKGACPFSTQ